MKNTLLIVFLMLFITAMSAQEPMNSIVDSSRRLGLVSYLTTIKSLSEFRLASELNGIVLNNERPELTKDQKNILARYNLLQTDINRFINQLAVDLARRNSLSIYRRLDRYMKYETSMPKNRIEYQSLLKEVHTKTRNFLKPTDEISAQEVGIENVLGVLKFGYDIYKDQRDSKRTKISSIQSALKELRFVNPTDLMKKG